MQHTDIDEIFNDINTFTENIYDIERQLENIEVDLDYNEYAKKIFGWNVFDIRKTLNKLLNQVNELKLKQNYEIARR